VLKFTSVFPVWERPPEPDPELMEAWEPFAGKIREIWEAHRDVAVGLAHEVVDDVGRLRASCPFIFREARRIVDDLLEKYRAIDTEVTRGTERPRWPPPGLARAGGRPDTRGGFAGRAPEARATGG